MEHRYQSTPSLLQILDKYFLNKTFLNKKQTTEKQVNIEIVQNIEQIANLKLHC